MKLKRKYGHGKEKKRQTRAKPEYENPARLFATERRRPAQKPTPKGPSQGSHPTESMQQPPRGGTWVGSTCDISETHGLQMQQPPRGGTWVGSTCDISETHRLQVLPCK
ncbi:hypothetical protein HZH68_008420 [Vespula germanica]|uniref:Uncharacterized protein n=1 Tax=Vespula germanica TaxID=30212 RepID=A0A834NA29_VESGE|nr:hypothetical protein HZH68_008420 [Vespula germanica]